MILSGKPVAEKIYTELKTDISELKTQKVMPTLGVVLVGEDPASLAYVHVKEHKSALLGVNFKLYHFSGPAPESKIAQLIEDLNRNNFVHGIVVQLPLPEDVDAELILKSINPQKDIDGFSGQFPAPTAQAILEIFKYYDIELKEKKIVLVGFGRLVGQPLAKALENQGIRPIICSSSTGDLEGQTLTADIIVSATGAPGIIKPDMVSEKAIVIDAGTAESKGEIHGDVDPSVYEKVTAYSPVPGGVGPVTVACLIENLVESAKKSIPLGGEEK